MAEFVRIVMLIRTILPPNLLLNLFLILVTISYSHSAMLIRLWSCLCVKSPRVSIASIQRGIVLNQPFTVMDLLKQQNVGMSFCTQFMKGHSMITLKYMGQRTVSSRLMMNTWGRHMGVDISIVPLHIYEICLPQHIWLTANHLHLLFINICLYVISKHWWSLLSYVLV